MNKQTLFLLIIFIIAFSLRFWQLGKIPPSIDWDEAALGYNAYSLIQTGKDEYGVSWPLVFRSFDDYKPPLYFYLTIPSVLLFGLNEYAVRFPSAFFGTLTVILTYFLVKELFKKEIEKKGKRHVFVFLPFTSSLLLAISPWHLYFSRIGFEANVGSFFNVLGVYLFLKSFSKPKLLIVSAIVFVLGLYEYHSERVFLPLLISGLFVIWCKKLFQFKKELIISVIVGMLLIIPLIKIMTSSGNLTRLQGTSAYADQTGLLSRNITKLEEAQRRGDLLGEIFANRRVTYAQVLINGYLAHFNFNWLFISGDQERHKAPGVGLMHWWELPFLLSGIYFFAKREDINSKVKKTLFWWFFISPVAASPTTEVPHAVRTLVFLPTLQIFTAFGTLIFLQRIRVFKNAAVRIASYSLFSLCLLFNFFYFLHQYSVHMPLEFSKYWQYGYKQAVDYVEENYDKYDKIVVSTQLEQPHIFFLFFLKYPPQKYLSEGGTASGGFEEYRNKFGKFEFRRISWDNENKNSKTLFIGPSNEIPGDGDYWIDYLDGTRAIEIKYGQ